MYGQIEYNEEGLPKCEICGKYFKRVLNHVRMSHDGMTEKEYKKKFGLDLRKGMSAELSRKWNHLYSKTVVRSNLLKDGRNTRFQKGHPGRTIDKVSPQTMKRLKQQSFIKKTVE